MGCGAVKFVSYEHNKAWRGGKELLTLTMRRYAGYFHIIVWLVGGWLPGDWVCSLLNLFITTVEPKRWPCLSSGISN